MLEWAPGCAHHGVRFRAIEPNVGSGDHPRRSWDGPARPPAQRLRTSRNVTQSCRGSHLSSLPGLARPGPLVAPGLKPDEADEARSSSAQRRGIEELESGRIGPVPVDDRQDGFAYVDG